MTEKTQAANSTVTAAILIIGNEILSGRTKDANVGYLAEQFTEIGIILSEVRMIPDDEGTIIKAINELRAQCAYVFTSGGIGPTHDDITSASIAKAFSVNLERNPEALAMLQSHYTPDELNESRLKMADIPAGASLIENPISKAPGFILENVHVLAGVPKILQAMFEQIRSQLTGGPKMLSHTLSSLKTEGVIAADLKRLQAEFPDVDIGSYPYFKNGEFGVSIVLRSTDAEQLEAAIKLAEDIIET